MTITTIKYIESEFDDIYRITTENGLILDICEGSKPEINTHIEYHIENNLDKIKEGYTIMNGIIFSKENNSIFVSFGGLLGNIPVDENINLNDEITLSYRLFD